MTEPHVSPMIERYCKRGHLRTKESTFDRKSVQNGKLYIVRECRICHSRRNNDAPQWSKGRSNAKWSRYLAEAGQ